MIAYNGPMPQQGFAGQMQQQQAPQFNQGQPMANSWQNLNQQAQQGIGRGLAFGGSQGGQQNYIGRPGVNMPSNFYGQMPGSGFQGGPSLAQQKMNDPRFQGGPKPAIQDMYGSQGSGSPWGGFDSMYGQGQNGWMDQMQQQFGQQQPQQQQQASRPAWQNYGLNDQQQGRVKDLRQQYRQQGDGISNRERADLQQMQQNMQMRNAGGYNVERGQGRNMNLRNRGQVDPGMAPPMGPGQADMGLGQPAPEMAPPPMQAPPIGNNMASQASGPAKQAGGRKGRKGVTGSRPKRIAQARQNRRRNR